MQQVRTKQLNYQKHNPAHSPGPYHHPHCPSKHFSEYILHAVSIQAPQNVSTWCRWVQKVWKKVHDLISPI